MRKLGFAAMAALVMACGGSGDGGVNDGQKPKEEIPEGSASAIPPNEPSTLRKVQTCDELGSAIKEDALKKMNDTVDAQVESIKLWFDGQFGGLSTLPGGAGGERGGADASNAGAPSTPGGSAPPAPGGSASDYSTTNTQVKGVDEADIVKNDGKYIYLIHGAAFQIVQAWPAPELAASTKVDLEGQPTEMFVANGKAVVFSTVNGTTIYQSAGVTPRTKTTNGGYYPGCSGYGCSYQNPMTKVTVLGVNGTSAGVEREFYFEGGYVSSRRVDAMVRLILKGGAYGPSIQTYPTFGPRPAGSAPLTKEDHIAAWEALRSKNAQMINATQLSDWLPYTFTKNGSGGYTAETVACDRFYVPTQSTTEHGVTHIASFDLGKAAPSNSVAILGNVDTVYSNADTMVLAAKAWINPKTMVTRPENKKAPFVDFLPSTATHLHKFDLKADPTSPTYTGSGVVPGHVLNQFSIDEREGIVRVATTEQRSVRTWISDDPKVRPFINQFTVNRVLATKSDGEKIKIVGNAGDLAPGERIFSARFVNTRGYIVTFRQIDPLFVIDMATPEKLSILGELKIPGFSEYMHPLDDGHLLTIGRDTENGARRGIAIQIFDVTNAKEPKQMHKYVFESSTYGYSEAEQNHKAFTYFESKKLLSFPFYGWSQTTGSSSFRTSAELFSIDLASGITKLGSVDHSQLFGTNYRGYCNGYYSPHVRRSVFMDDVLYSVSYAGVIASDTKNLAAAPLGRATLAAPTIPPGTPYQCL
jgi:uncharacterized secreted protein with C-terminal beta-propeller domain